MINLGEVGIKFIIDLSEAVDNTANTITLRPPKASYKDEVTYPALIGAVPLDTEVGLLKADEYIYYLIQSGDIDTDGRWYARATNTEADRVRKTDWIPFQVRK
tara:strand:- start:613 stop:921 length:309 start_codon:yes stop_codon:yes gene_type:complete